MESIDILALLPLIVLAAAVVIIMLVIAFYRNHRLTLWLSLIGLAASFATLPVAASYAPRQVTELLVVDGYAIYYIGLMLITSFAVLLLSFGYLESFSAQKEEFYLLVLLGTLGSSILVISDHFISFFLGLEILSVALYAMVSYTKFDRNRIEAALKYLILAGVAVAFLLFGMALIYLQVGSMAFPDIAASGALSGMLTPIVLAGLGLIIVGVGFKLALVPFHMWTPDVYQGASAPVTGFIATVSKGGMFVLMLRYFTGISFYDQRLVWLVFAAIAVASMLVSAFWPIPPSPIWVT
jgi:NADH-quinone oxidoreductase subunit N